MNRPIVFELCAETLDACLAARAGGADRLELCTALKVGGLTPPLSLIEQAAGASGLPVHVLIRPHANSFAYDAEAFNAICRDIQHVRRAGASGVVVGVLHADGRVDRERTRALVELADPLEVTFHRAIDATPNLEEALEEVIAAGCQRVLTSGGAPNVAAGAEMLARLVRRAGDRIAIAAGGGLRLAHVQQIAQVTGARHFHSSLPPEENAPAELSERIRTLVRLLRTA